MTETEQRIIEAAIRTFVRYGPKKTTMADIAAAAEVSRQTVYASFGDKDGVVVACIRHMTDTSLAAAASRLAMAPSLADKLDAYFAETVVMAFELLRTSGDAEDLISGHTTAGRAELDRAHQRHKAFVGGMLEPHDAAIAASGRSRAELANFTVTVAMALKAATLDRAEFDSLLGSLKTAVLCMTGERDPD